MFFRNMPPLVRTSFFRIARSTLTHQQEQNYLGWSLHTLIFGPPSIMPALLGLNSFNLRTQSLFDQQCFDSNYIHYSILSGSSPFSNSNGHQMPRMSAGNLTHQSKANTWFSLSWQKNLNPVEVLFSWRLCPGTTEPGFGWMFPSIRPESVYGCP